MTPRHAVHVALYVMSLSAVISSAASSLHAVAATAYILSGSSDGTERILVDDDLDVYLNGNLIYTDGTAGSGYRQPIPIMANVGDTLRLVLRDTYGVCASLGRVFITDSAGRNVVVDPGFSAGCSAPNTDQGVKHDVSFVIPVLPELPVFGEIPLPGSAFAGVVRTSGGLYGVTYDGGTADAGTLYRATADAAIVLYNFTGGADGSVPYAELIAGSGAAAGKLFGTTYRGGANNAGTLFSYEPGSNTFSTLVTFAFPQSGLTSPLVQVGDFLYGSTSSYPSGSSIFRVRTNGADFRTLHFFAAEEGLAPGGLTLGRDGFLWGVAQFGGDLTCGLPGWPYGCGTVFRFDPAAPVPEETVVEVVHPFGPSSGYPQRKLALGSSPDDFFYGTTFNSVFKVGPGFFQTIYTAPNRQGGNQIFTPPIEGADGRLYGVQYDGGSDFAGTVFSVAKDGTGLLVHHEFSYDSGGANPYGILYRDSAGAIVGTTEYSFDGPGTIFVIRGSNLAPIAAATAPASVPAGANCVADVAFDGSTSSDPNNDALTYLWKEGAVTLSTAAQFTTSLSAGAHTITLTVTDPSGAFDSIDVNVQVVSSAALTYTGPDLLQQNGNNLLSARLTIAGAPVAAAAVSFTVDGVVYPAVTDAAGIATVAVALAGGGASATIKVEYAGGACGGATTTVTRFVNRWPVASAFASSPNVAGPACTASVTLNASASSDIDNDALTFLWKEGATTLATTATAVITLGGGSHPITLTVDDGRGGTSSSIINVEVSGQPSALVYSGPAQTISGASTPLSASLRTDAGAPIVGATVRFTLDGFSVTAVTDAAGLASSAVTASTTGNRTVRIEYVGDFCHQGVVLQSPLEVLAQPATVNVIVQVVNDNGGARSPADFIVSAFGIAPIPSSFPGSSAGTSVVFNAGAYSVTQEALGGYDTTASADCNGVIALGETKTCTIVNNDRPATLRLTKIVRNDNGGAALASAWALTANGAPFVSDAVTVVAAGDYTLAESGGPSGYTPGAWSCMGGDLVGNVVTVAATTAVACTITNDDQPATLTLTKIVLNDNGGAAVPANWTLTANGTPFVSGVSASVNAGTYVLAESVGPPGYVASGWSCIGGAPVGASLTLVPGQVASCSITNDDQAAYLLVIKHVINNNGGLRSAADFSMNVTGGAPTPATFPGSEGGTPVTLTPGPYSVTETGPRGYVATYSADCSGTIAIGESKTCTVTNDDRLPAPPVANDRLVTTLEDIAVNITVTGSDADGDPLTFEILSQPAHGALTGQAPALRYTPDANYNGQDTFTFRVNDGVFNSNVATVTITLTPVNDPPVATPQLVMTPEDVALGIALAGTDVDGDVLTFSVVTPPQHGQLTGIGATLTYTPNANYNGPDFFTFTASDSFALSASATIDITVTPVNDRPTAAGQVATTPEDVPLALVLSGADIDGDALGYAIVAGPAHGVLTGAPPNVTYTPALDYVGPDSFTFTATDGPLVSTAATVSIAVTPVNDPPMAADDAIATAPRTAVTITVLANDDDIDGNPLIVTDAGPAGNGSVVRNANGSITYTPRNKFAGTDTFTYTITDGQGGTATATVRVTVDAGANAAPRAARDAGTTTMSTPITIAVLANDSDADGDPLSIVAVTSPAGGAAVANANGTITYTPAAAFRGQDRFTYTISDGRGGTAIGDVRVRVQ